jgi:hypothetical protein
MFGAKKGKKYQMLDIIIDSTYCRRSLSDCSWDKCWENDQIAYQQKRGVNE